MKKHNLLTLTLFVVSLARLHGQDRVTSYLPTLVEGAGILEVTETYTPSGGSGYINKTLVRAEDTAAMRKYMTAEMAFQEAEADRYAALQAEARATADSLYAELEILNEGLGAVDGPEPLREPSRPDDGPAFRWGAVLPGKSKDVGILNGVETS